MSVGIWVIAFELMLLNIILAIRLPELIEAVGR